jgi:Protein of unknown function (DUF2652)
MPATPVTILIPDISGYTDFMSSIELEHGSHLISSFLETILQEVNPDFEVSEIEGDAVLLYKKGGVNSREEIVGQCLKMFNAFHTQRKMFQQMVLCPCGACQGMINLSLKFVAHHGNVSEIKVGKFIKASGLDMIIAHRLLKNNIKAEEYVLLTKNCLEQMNEGQDESGLEWQSAEEEYPSIGKVDFQFALLEKLRSNIPDPPKVEFSYKVDDRSTIETIINALYKDVYLAVIDITNRIHWMKGFTSLAAGDDHAFVGSLHTCVFEDYKAVISPLQTRVNKEEVIYAEKMIVEAMNLEFVYEYRFRPTDTKGCQLDCRVLPLDEKPLADETHYYLFEDLRKSCARLKEYCEQSKAMAASKKN